MVRTLTARPLARRASPRATSSRSPVAIPVNAVGNTVNVVGILNPAFGNDGFNG
jgi:hypothetical protein